MVARLSTVERAGSQCGVYGAFQCLPYLWNVTGRSRIFVTFFVDFSCSDYFSLSSSSSFFPFKIQASVLSDVHDEHFNGTGKEGYYSSAAIYSMVRLFGVVHRLIVWFARLSSLFRVVWPLSFSLLRKHWRTGGYEFPRLIDRLSGLCKNNPPWLISAVMAAANWMLLPWWDFEKRRRKGRYCLMKSCTVLSLGVRSLFGPTRKSSPLGQFFRRLIKSINQSMAEALRSRSFQLIDWLTIS